MERGLGIDERKQVSAGGRGLQAKEPLDQRGSEDQKPATARWSGDENPSGMVVWWYGGMIFSFE